MFSIHEKRQNLFTRLKVEEFVKDKDDILILIHLLTDELKNEISCLEIGRHIYECFRLRSCSIPKWTDV